jgi:hypothetical protein
MHGMLELMAGMATLAAPTIFAFGAAGIVTCVLLGSLLVGMGLTLQGRLGSAVAWHGSFDSVFVLLAAVAALVLAIAGDKGPAVFFAALVGVQAALSFTTRYVAAG